jgi:hypothetical protein
VTSSSLSTRSSPEDSNNGAVGVGFRAEAPEGSGDNRCRISEAVELDTRAPPCNSSSLEMRVNEMLGRQTSLLVVA